MAAPSGRILLNDGASAPLTTQSDGSLTGSFRIDRQGFYRIELTGPHAEKVDASPQYTIDVIDDQAPAVHFTKPGRDTQATPVEELFLEARADDDYGVKSLQLFYSVNGAPPKAINLFGGSKPLPEVSAGHTVYLEELGLKPGDEFHPYHGLRFNETDPGREDFVVAAGSFAKSLQNNISKPVSGLLKLARGAPKARFP